MTCERCGNDFFRKPVFDEATGKKVIICPFCHYRNTPPRGKKHKPSNDKRYHK